MDLGFSLRVIKVYGCKRLGCRVYTVAVQGLWIYRFGIWGCRGFRCGGFRFCAGSGIQGFLRVAGMCCPLFQHSFNLATLFICLFVSLSLTSVVCS